MSELDETSAHAAPLDEFALALQHLREERGVSYTDIAVRVTALRIERGMHVAAARTPRSTVYTCFSTGRTRIDAALLRDIVLVLTDDAHHADEWVSRYLDARRRQTAMRSTRAAATSPDPAAPAPAVPQRTPQTRRLSPGTIALVMLGAIVLNRVGLDTNTYFGFSLFLDMIGTCAAALILGPWFGVAVAVIHHCISAFTSPDPVALFVLVNITGALVWGYGIRRFRMGRSMIRFTLLGVAAAVACSLVGIPLNMILSAHGTATGLDSSVLSLESAGVTFESALVSANITASLIDKFLTGFVAIIIFVLLHRRFGFPADHLPLVEHLGRMGDADRLDFAHDARSVAARTRPGLRRLVLGTAGQ